MDINKVGDADAIRACLIELLRLYDWRLVIAGVERTAAPADLDVAERIRKDLLKYGREKKAAWELARKLLTPG